MLTHLLFTDWFGVSKVWNYIPYSSSSSSSVSSAVISASTSSLSSYLPFSSSTQPANQDDFDLSFVFTPETMKQLYDSVEEYGGSSSITGNAVGFESWNDNMCL